MKKPARASLDAYFAEGDSWATDRRDDDRASRKIAWIVATAAAVIAVCEALALVALTPLKTVEPLTLLVDRQTGFVQALRPLETNMIAGDAALTQSFLVQYVIAREGYDAAGLQADYRKVGVWSTGTARAQYLSEMQASNPRSPLALYPRSTIVDVQVKSVTPLGRQSAMVRYDTARQDADGRRHAPRAWVAVIRYLYVREPLSVADRYVNPLGFQVASFHRSQETLSSPPRDALRGDTAEGPSQGVGVAPGAMPQVGPGERSAVPPYRRLRSE